MAVTDLISIHAPAKGATRIDTEDVDKIKFQSTLPRRERLHDKLLIIKMLDFNPHSREGSDFMLIFRVHHLNNFNPRSREGSDSYIATQFETREISIHAPAKGATGLSDSERALGYISIHAPAKGATRTK